jgi:hypothetical protein
VRRALLVAVVAVVALGALTSACSSEQRPEGITERWLLSLNQGAAGRPDRYAPDEVSQQVVPGWHDLDPGFLDVITVEPALFIRGAIPGTLVPFHLVTKDGDEIDGTARLLQSGDSWRISDVGGGTPSTEGGTPFGAGLPGWPIALAVGALLALAALGLLTIVQRRATKA